MVVGGHKLLTEEVVYLLVRGGEYFLAEAFVEDEKCVVALKEIYKQYKSERGR